jgi:hypothetical protein
MEHSNKLNMSRVTDKILRLRLKMLFLTKCEHGCSRERYRPLASIFGKKKMKEKRKYTKY